MRQARAQEILAEVEIEISRAQAKFGDQRKSADGCAWLTILTEEVGELARAILKESTPTERKEAIQVAAVIFRMIDARYYEP